MGAVTESEDLEALFDSIAAQSAAERAAPPAAAAPAAPAAPGAADPAPDAALTSFDVFQRIGNVTRSLHDALRELGYDKKVENAVGSLPDARARLAYVASLTGKAADRVLGAVERAKVQHDAVKEGAAGLGARWEALYAGTLSVDEFKALAGDTRQFLGGHAARAVDIDAQLTEIMMAQDFHDLTGQVIQRITQVAQSLEDQLVKLLVEATPPDQRAQVEEGWLNGPVINAEGRSDVVTSQGQVDDLLESLGF